MPQTINIQCSNCGQPVQADVESIIDAQSNPRAKAALINGQLNVAVCDQCGAGNNIVTPLLYHDAEKELLIAFVPMEAAMQANRPNEEKIIGDMMNALTRSIPKEQFKAYMFNPKRALTMQGLIDQVLEADGITPEMMQAQQMRIQLIQDLLGAMENNVLESMVTQRDADIDMAFFQTMSLMAQSLMQQGQQGVVQQLALLQDQLLTLSTVGKELAADQAHQEQVVQELSQEIQNLGQNMTRADFVDMVVRYADDDVRLQALVGMVRPAFDYEFFQELSQVIEQTPEADRATLEAARERLTVLTRTVDDQMRASMQQSASVLQAMLSAPDLDAFIQANFDLIDDNFMAVLSANLQQAQQKQDTAMLGRLQQIYEKVVAQLQSQMSPELHFVNDLLSAESDEAAAALMHQRAAEFGPDLLEIFASVEEMLEAQGQDGVLARLRHVQQVATTLFS